MLCLSICKDNTFGSGRKSNGLLTVNVLLKQLEIYNIFTLNVEML
jgi:hypothetical protein